MKRLDEKGRCCGRKPLKYKTPYPHYFCFRCDAEYDEEGNQVPNFGWIKNKDGDLEKKLRTGLNNGPLLRGRRDER